MANMAIKMRVAGITAAGRGRMLAALAAGLLALSGCGSGATKTVSVSSAAPSGTTTQSPTTTGTTPSSPTTTTRTSTTTSTTGQGNAETTRTTTAPAFTKQAGGGEGLSAAVAVVKEHGFTPNETSDYHSGQTLRVLVGTNGSGQQAFFFVDGHYLGTDTKEPSAGVNVSGQSDTEVTLTYPLYKAGVSTGGQATVHFQLNNGHLVPLNPIPPASSQTGTSRH
jgi:hypothetical protein